MKEYLNNNFLLDNRTAESLYHETAENLPIVDYHNHLNPMYLAENKHFETIASLWITEDPYKHRAMRINGIPEKGITGNVSEKEKYLNWVKTFPKTIGNPLFHWSCMELKSIFGIDEILSEHNAGEIWNTCNSKLQEDGFGALDILRSWKAEIVCTSDDLTHDLTPHKTATEKGFGLKVLPSLRADSILAFDAPDFSEWLKKLSGQYGSTITTIDDYKEAIVKRLDYFNESGCKLSDHSLDAGFTFALTPEPEAEISFASHLKGTKLSDNELYALKSHLLIFLGGEYNKRGWVMELHIGAHRYTSSRLRQLAGPKGGYATIGNSCDINSLCCFLDTLEQQEHLPRTILFTLNPADNESFATITGSYAQDGVAGKIQFGPAWWFNDNYEGIRQQLTVQASFGLLSNFIGMTTDSRCILSFSRHEYFRRILCNILGTWVENGQLPNDLNLLGQMVKDISYTNSKRMIFNN